MDHVIKRLQWHESIKQHAAETQYIAHYYKFTPLQFCYEIFLVKRRLGQKKTKPQKQNLVLTMLITPTTVTKGENMRTEIRNKVQKVRLGTKLAPDKKQHKADRKVSTATSKVK